MLQLYSVKVHVPIDWDQEIMNTHRPCIQHLSHVSVLLSMLQLYCMGLYMLRVDWEQGAVSNRMSIASRLCLTSHQCTGSSQLYRAECDEWIESSKHCTHTGHATRICLVSQSCYPCYSYTVWSLHVTNGLGTGNNKFSCEWCT